MERLAIVTISRFTHRLAHEAAQAETGTVCWADGIAGAGHASGRRAERSAVQA
ncbi:hypothetical protein [Methylobacterium sp. 77]|uniref:hypothetical protein n=1 Tax=Methylobacterium sp. 77 TaxID=1101192 RepID=UPI0003630BB7|nr:hypothetical protein [Methylobacterium sp. 77]